MINILIGIIIGSVMGLTGAGGALIAIPLFMQFLEMSLKEASVYSLICVFIASILNFIAQYKNADLRLGLILVVFSGLGSMMGHPLKVLVNENVISVLLALIAIYALLMLWSKKEISLIDDFKISKKKYYFLSIFLGINLGILTTLTGLGGGVLMMPLLVKFFAFTTMRAIATSLLSVALSSLISLMIQIYFGSSFQMDTSLIFVILGIIFSVFFVKYISSHLRSEKLKLVNQITFTIVVGVMLIKLFIIK